MVQAVGLIPYATQNHAIFEHKQNSLQVEKVKSGHHNPDNSILFGGGIAPLVMLRGKHHSSTTHAGKKQ